MPKEDNELSLGADSRPLPASFDWRLRSGVVGPVRDQRSCGSCWTFSALSALESQFKIRKNVTLDLSEQELVDCVYPFYSCEIGGFMHEGKLHFIELKFKTKIN